MFKIYTKTGDKGETSLYGGTRVKKSDIRIEAYGTIDELNSYIGLLRDQEVNSQRKDLLVAIQNCLFTIGSLLAADPAKKNLNLPELFETDIQFLEVQIDEMEGTLTPLKNFILPGGHSSVSFCHIARCVCRRAERKVIFLNDLSPVNPLIIPYLNRLSDFLFVLSRKNSSELNAEEIPWKK